MRPMKTIEVKIPAAPAGSYPIYIGSGLLEGLPRELAGRFGGRRVFIVTDENVAEAGHLAALNREGDAEEYVINPPGEVSKNIQTVIEIVEKMERAYYGRDALVAALGGGTVGDMAGFVGAIFKRGVPVVQIPTTTVAQADSAIGGKTGVDSTLSKNAFGCFHQPAAVYIDTATLATLDERQYRAGLVESVKHALIMDAEYFAYIEANLEAILRRDAGALEVLAEKNCRIKAAVVEEDPTEKNRRRVLNYGHTIGHAVESASDYEILHGEAVAIGIAAASRLGMEKGLTGQAEHERILSVLGKLQMPLEIPSEMAADELMDLIRRDKKAVNKWPPFILLERIGAAACPSGQWAVDVEPSLVEKIIGQMRG